MTANEAIQVLIDEGIITTGEYWVNACGCVKYLPELLVNMAQKVK